MSSRRSGFAVSAIAGEGKRSAAQVGTPSGGSQGYDHKGMGITARGAWEAVKRHFREVDVDIQTTPFTVAGVGDMSGDVFGNGMLRSTHTRLIAAFDHRHVFVDPDPDPAISFAERDRLFKLPRSSWADYNAKLISKGGGIFDRKAKSIKLTPEIKKALDIPAESVTPFELMKAILRAPVDLLFFGGIGNYIKATSESHAECGDRANDAIRVDGREIRARVVGAFPGASVTFAPHLKRQAIVDSWPADVDDSAARLQCPVLVLRGASSDVLSQQGAEEVAALIPNAHLETVEKAGHLAAGDNPHSTVGLVATFLDRLRW